MFLPVLLVCWFYAEISSAEGKSKYPCSGPDKAKCEFCYDDQGGNWNPKTRKCDVNSQMVFGKDVGIPQKKAQPPNKDDKGKDKDKEKDKDKNKNKKSKDKKK